jgi:hypothetical protein
VTHWWLWPAVFGTPLALSAIVTLCRKRFYFYTDPKGFDRADYVQNDLDSFEPVKRAEAFYPTTRLRNTDLDDRPRY